ncbi:DUF2652 domain-containing protein [Sinomicrobium oceani]|uniref:DUF2652 domain-containing protein n=1 Tax=Sinomicrobium oceani TaxID=1150368 RepID=UPI00227A9D9A|nr:DUF2652 domain-containing protein [Sinomicrobium oceani]
MKSTTPARYAARPIHSPRNTPVVGEGTIIIPDISGFTSFVHETDADTGKYITRELLSAIVDSNVLNLKISEIEGDAVLFYGYGIPANLQSVVEQYEIMLQNFNRKLAQLEAFIGHKINLSLKLVAHYGQVSEYNIGRFRKLYGKAVVQAHQLLKNSIRSKTYILLTESLLHAIPSVFGNVANRGIPGSSDDIAYTYYNYEPLLIEA